MHIIWATSCSLNSLFCRGVRSTFLPTITLITLLYCLMQPAVPPPEPLIETPPLGCLHPLYRGGKAYFATPAEYMKWCVCGGGDRWGREQSSGGGRRGGGRNSA